MTKIKGQLRKMQVHNSDPIEYTFVLKGQNAVTGVNQFLGKQLGLHFTGKINCIECDRALQKTYQQGYCFPCTQKLAACDMCILKPELCHYAAGTCREPQWGLTHCFIPHIVYLANSSGVKVGLTRETQVPTRWIDQGATQALPIMRVQSRFQAGLLEVAFAQMVSDKTDWRKMLRGANSDQDLLIKRDELIADLVKDIQKVAGKFTFGDIEILTSEAVQSFNYPILEYPQKVVALNLDKTPEIAGVLLGIKGQYLIFDSGVINIRKYAGYEVELNFEG